MLPTITWENDVVVMIDQRKLPQKEVYLKLRSVEQVALAIENMTIRGAPAIGLAAAYGLALATHQVKSEKNLDETFEKAYERLWRTRPTARNLFWALERMKRVFNKNRKQGLEALKDVLLAEAKKMDMEDLAMNMKIGEYGQRLVSDGDTILTHCNAGGLATAGYGTALGVIRAAVAHGKRIKVLSDETRPLLQGARLTCWELQREGIPVTLITDNMAGYLMKKGEISLVVVGADRIALNGDTANKIGTYSAAILAREHHLPFYVAAPLSTFDFSIKTGEAIPIEERQSNEVRKIGGKLITVADIQVRNPAFDVTPARLISGIITEHGLLRPPFGPAIKKIAGG
ncbi:MAG TPA: S-methyl-5-thioribose-1-phosphate isomerase [Candidatus Saccharicenans sp.]|jgi:methylthioribose-1-phosphate isomerase|nr:S-methyl-5-thioribose-1-phosphate isomerase [Candidatus Saccharicenans sp.]HRD02990.1 S-methyl-5-thioribose-1-phosphate isomerase [Candidatus Saccharicenans sp.]